MLHTGLLFFHTAEEDKNYNEELELSSIKASPWFELSTVLAICILISILGLIGNGITFWLLSCTSRKTKFTVYVANMAAGDFLALLRSFISFLEFFTPLLVKARARQLMLIMYLFGHETNSYFLAAMITERCLTVFSPVWYQFHRRQCPTALICAFLWTLSVMMSMMDHFLCTLKYITALNIGTVPCKVATSFKYIIRFIIIAPSMVFCTLALFIRMRRKPQQDFPTGLDISIWITVILHLIFYPATEILSLIVFSTPFSFHVTFYYITLIFYCMGSAVNPFVYLLVGCWKMEEEPFYMFLERALKDERNSRMSTQPDQEQA